jgi:D-sedoheptulose 7-phosphate isomerase
MVKTPFGGLPLVANDAAPNDQPDQTGTPAIGRAFAYFEDLHALLKGVETTDCNGEGIELEMGMELAVDVLVKAAAQGHKVLLVGNGGSAAIVSHAQVDLLKAARIPALVFTDGPLLTAFANDEGYEHAFDDIAGTWVRRGDVLWAVSSSGRSSNILGAARTCAARGATVITMSGFHADNPLRGIGHLNFYAAASAYGLVELAHGCLAHYLTDRAVDRQGRGG